MDMSFNMHNVNEIIVSHGIGEGGRVQKFIDSIIYFNVIFNK